VLSATGALFTDPGIDKDLTLSNFSNSKKEIVLSDLQKTSKSNLYILFGLLGSYSIFVLFTEYLSMSVVVILKPENVGYHQYPEVKVPPPKAGPIVTPLL